jgi:hypothetical protein
MSRYLPVDVGLADVAAFHLLITRWRGREKENDMEERREENREEGRRRLVPFSRAVRLTPMRPDCRTRNSSEHRHPSRGVLLFAIQVWGDLS